MSELKVDKVSPRTGTYVSLNTVGSKNIIINGDMSLAQRSTSEASLTSTAYTYPTLDRWFFTRTADCGTWTMSQSTDVPSGYGFATSLKLDCTATASVSGASTDLRIIQKFEGQNLQYLKYGSANAQSTTLSFWVKSTKTGTFIAELNSKDTRSISKSYTVSVSNTWEYKTITFAGDVSGVIDNDNSEELQVIFWLVAGTTFTSGTLNTSWGSMTNANRAVGQVNIGDNTANDFLITGVQLEAGTTASDFEFLPYDVNLLRCQRYYNKYISSGSNIGASYNGSSGTFFVYFPTTMRATPTKSSTSGTSFYRFYRLSSYDDITSLGDNGGKKEYMSFSFATTSAGGTGGELSVRTGGVLEADAEL